MRKYVILCMVPFGGFALIIKIITRILLIPGGGKKAFEISATIAGVAAAALASRLQNQRIEEVHKQIELLQSPRIEPTAIVAESKKTPFGFITRMMHICVKIAPIMTGRTPQEVLRYVIWGLIRNGWSHTVDNMPGYLNREQMRLSGKAIHPSMSYQLNSPRAVFPNECREFIDSSQNREFTEEAELVTLHTDLKVIIVLGTILMYARVLLVFLAARELYLIMGKYLASKDIVVIDTTSKVRKRKVLKPSVVIKKE